MLILMVLAMLMAILLLLMPIAFVTLMVMVGVMAIHPVTHGNANGKGTMLVAFTR